MNEGEMGNSRVSCDIMGTSKEKGRACEGEQYQKEMG